MDWLEEKYEITVAALLVVIICSCIWLFAHFEHVQEVRAQDEISFEMPRPKNLLNSLFDLVGREIERTFINPFAVVENFKSKENNKTVPAPIPPPNKTAQVLKKADEKKKSQVSMRVVEAAKSKNSFFSEKTNLENDGSQVVRAPTFVSKKPSEETGSQPDDKKELISPEQWRALLSAQPTQENLQKLLAAYQNKEIDSKSFYIIIHDLMKSNKSEMQNLGLYALRATPSYYSFSELIHSQELVEASLQSGVTQALQAYVSAANVGILGQAMQSTDAQVYGKAFEMTTTLVSSLKTQLQNKDLTQQDQATAQLVSQWNAVKNLVNLLKQMSSSKDSPTAQLATNLLQQIQQQS